MLKYPMNKEKFASVIFGTIVNFIALFLILTEAENRLMWLFVIPFMMWPIVAVKSEKLAIIMASISAVVSITLFATGFFVRNTTVQSTMRFVFAFPIPTLLIAALLFSSISDKKDINLKKWSKIKSKVPENEETPTVEGSELPKL